MSFCFCETASKDNVTVAVISIVTQKWFITFIKVSKDRIITYEELENSVWDEDSIMTSNAMRLFIKNFRKKLPENFLKNIQGVGYKLVKN